MSGRSAVRNKLEMPSKPSSTASLRTSSGRLCWREHTCLSTPSCCFSDGLLTCLVRGSRRALAESRSGYDANGCEDADEHRPSAHGNRIIASERKASGAESRELKRRRVDPSHRFSSSQGGARYVAMACCVLTYASAFSRPRKGIATLVWFGRCVHCFDGAFTVLIGCRW